MDDLGLLLQLVLELVKSRELEKANEAVGAAEREYRVASLRARQAAVQELSLALAKAKQMREAIVAELQKLPEKDRFDATHRLMPVIDTLYNTEIAKLRAQKRQLARPT